MTPWSPLLQPGYPNLCSIDAFRWFVDRSLPVPGLTRREYARLSDEDRFEYDLYRGMWLRNELRLLTPEWDRADAIIRRQILMNPRRTSGRDSTVIAAAPLGGKTELAKHVATRVELRAQKANPNYRNDDQVPVAWVDVPANANAKTLLQQIGLFFLPFPALRSTATELQRQVVELTTRHKTALIVLDEAQNLTGRRGMGRTEATDMIKLLQNHSQATVMLIGVDLDTSDVLGNDHGRQILDRADVVRINPIDRGDDVGKARWEALLRGFEQQLPLRDREEDFLVGQAELMYSATAGSLGRLARLTYALLDEVFIHSAQHPADPERILQTQFDSIVRPAAAQQLVVVPRKAVA